MLVAGVASGWCGVGDSKRTTTSGAGRVGYGEDGERVRSRWRLRGKVEVKVKVKRGCM